MLKKELAVEVKKDGGLLLPRNLPKQNYEYLLDILKKINKPTHLSVIRSEMKRIIPGLSFSAESVRYLLLKHRELFVFFWQKHLWFKKLEKQRGISKEAAS